jgi:hypothetical protein
MRKPPILILITVFAFILSKTWAQSDSSDIRNGKIYGDLFLNANYNVADELLSFRLNRLHFGYKYTFSKEFYFNGMIESALENYDPIPEGGDYDDITNLFEFCFGFKKGKFEGKFGLIGTELNQQQEKLWKHRYVDKVFVDKYGYAPTNDFGAIGIYRYNNMLTFDVAVTNGEGHKHLPADSALRFSGGITSYLFDKFILRAYSDIETKDTLQTNFIAVFGYQSEILTAGMEYNMQTNSGGKNDFNRNGVSLYATGNINQKIQLFGRFDLSKSNKPEGYKGNWNSENDGSLIISGVQYQLIENAILSFNYRHWLPKNKDIDDMSLLFLDVAVQF